jgi:Domain of unknown function (DUF4112)
MAHSTAKTPDPTSVRPPLDADAPVLDSELAPPRWAEELVRWLDDGILIPGTRVGLGLDAILGFFLPVVGDVAMALAATALVVLAVSMRLPKVVVLRMIFNIAADLVLGCIPFLGDLFDVFFRSNRRNLELIRRHAQEPSRRADLGDYAIVVFGVSVLAAAIVLPVLLGLTLIHAVVHALNAG